MSDFESAEQVTIGATHFRVSGDGTMWASRDGLTWIRHDGPIAVGAYGGPASPRVVIGIDYARGRDWTVRGDPNL